MKIYKITEASEYLGVSINTIKTLANNGKVKSFKTSWARRVRELREDEHWPILTNSGAMLYLQPGREEHHGRKADLDLVTRSNQTGRDR